MCDSLALLTEERTGFARKITKKESLFGIEAFSAIFAYLCDLCVKYSREKSLTQR